MASVVAVLFIVSFLAVGFVAAAPEVKLQSGIVQGKDQEAVTTAKSYHAYYGIPFAQPPLGDLRFEPPMPYVAETPDTVINSDDYRESCIQYPATWNSPQSEDCLYLNVFIPWMDNGVADGTRDRKVMVWIHGGSYVSGSARNFSPSRLVTDHDVIVVTIQYRLGPFGFLSSGDDVLPGNMGLQDQIQALKWVKVNIGFFGGDANDVTIFGQSAGGASASILAVSPLAKGLFTKVILLSGTALAPWTLNRRPWSTYFLVAKKTKCLPWYYFLGLSRVFKQRLLTCLKRISPRDLSNAIAGEILKAAADLDLETYISYSPVVDGSVLRKPPSQLLADSNYLRDVGALDRKYMMGVTNNEGIYVIETLLQLGYTPESLVSDAVAGRVLRTTLESVFSLPFSHDLLNFASLMYLYPRNWKGQVQLQSLVDLFTDTYFVVPAILLARDLVKASSQVDVYLYLFDHYPQLKQPDSVFQGSEHGIDVYFLFDENPAIEDALSSFAKIWTPSAKPLLDNFRSSLTNMAKSGNPQVSGTSLTSACYERQNETYVVFSATPEVRRHMYARRVSLWTDFLPRVAGAIFDSGPGRAPFRILM